VIACFEIDANGKKSIQITNNGSLSRVEIEKMIEDAYK
ncbi:hypothetical protein Tco_1165924, partial [Tanacetum coccineum]